MYVPFYLHFDGRVMGRYSLCSTRCAGVYDTYTMCIISTRNQFMCTRRRHVISLSLSSAPWRWCVVVLFAHIYMYVHSFIYNVCTSTPWEKPVYAHRTCNNTGYPYVSDRVDSLFVVDRACKVDASTIPPLAAVYRPFPKLYQRQKWPPLLFVTVIPPAIHNRREALYVFSARGGG